MNHSNQVYNYQLDVEKYKIALSVANVFGCNVYDVIGFKDTDEKILAIWLEILLSGTAVFQELADKYQIYQRYMLNQIAGLDERLAKGGVFLDKMLLLQSAFNL